MMSSAITAMADARGQRRFWSGAIIDNRELGPDEAPDNEPTSAPSRREAKDAGRRAKRGRR